MIARILKRKTEGEKEKAARIARIARKAKGPAAKQLAWEAWLAAEESWLDAPFEPTIRERFESWWSKR